MKLGFESPHIVDTYLPITMFECGFSVKGGKMGYKLGNFGLFLGLGYA